MTRLTRPTPGLAETREQRVSDTSCEEPSVLELDAPGTAVVYIFTAQVSGADRTV